MEIVNTILAIIGGFIIGYALGHFVLWPVILYHAGV